MSASSPAIAMICPPATPVASSAAASSASSAVVARPQWEHVGPIPQQAQLGELSLVLHSMGILHGAHHHDDGFYLVVAPHDAARSLRALRAYADENRDWPPRPAPERLPYATSNMAPFLMAALVVFFLVTGPVSGYTQWFSAGTAVSQRILHGEVWRAVTALTLHADGLHLLGNVFAGAIFLAAVFRRLGAGRGFFFTLVGGVLGNLANAAFHANILGGHRSIGASTAVFAAVGVLAATQFIVDRSRGARRWTDWAMPIVGSLALLGMLGSSPHADLWAHFFGLLGGALAGLVAMRTSGDRMHHGFPARDRAVQVHYGAAAAALLVSAWIVALVVARAHGL